jgi:hypothetical protein
MFVVDNDIVSVGLVAMLAYQFQVPVIKRARIELSPVLYYAEKYTTVFFLRQVTVRIKSK